MYGLDHDHYHVQEDMFGQSKEENDTFYVFVLVIASGHIHYDFVLLAYGPFHESNHYKMTSFCFLSIITHYYEGKRCSR